MKLIGTVSSIHIKVKKILGPGFINNMTACFASCHSLKSKNTNKKDTALLFI